MLVHPFIYCNRVQERRIYVKKYEHLTYIGRVKINNIAKGVSINFGPSIHKGYQANSKIYTGEIVIGDEFTFNFCSENGNGENEENDNHYV
jgi:hypothetical protein